LTRSGCISTGPMIRPVDLSSANTTTWSSDGCTRRCRWLPTRVKSRRCNGLTLVRSLGSWRMERPLSRRLRSGANQLCSRHGCLVWSG